MKKNERIAIKKWTKAYKDWKASGETQIEYCQKKGYKINQFKNKTKWARKAKTDRLKSASFIPMEIESYEEPEPYCEMQFAGGHTVKFSDQESLIGLKNLIGRLVRGE